MRVFWFLFTSFISCLGDTLLVYAIPAGLGIENQDIRAAIFMWLVPAIAMYSATFCYKYISARIHHARRDFAYLLISIAVFEIIAAILTFKFSTPHHTFVLSCIFVFIYALAKEGIPKIFYDVQIYRFFVDENKYARLAGWNSALSIVARITGGLIASYLILKGTWRFAFVVDAITFVIFGMAILFIGKDAKVEDSDNFPDSVQVNDSSDPKSKTKKYAHLLVAINVVIPLLFAFNALSWNYISLIVEKLSVSNVASGILFITLLQIPGLILGVNFDRLLGKVNLGHFLVTIPTCFFIAVLLFIAFPSQKLFFLCIVLFGLVTGLMWPSEIYIKSRMGIREMIKFNNLVLKRLSGFQFLSCILALGVYSLDDFQLPAILATCLVAMIIYLTRNRKVNLIPGFSCLGIALICMLFISCTKVSNEHHVLLPSVTKDLRLRTELTYAGMAILNDTSAHLVKVSKKLKVEGEILKNYKEQDNGKTYILNLDPEYLSARKERITANDVAYTFKWYLLNHKSMAPQLTYIEGAEICTVLDCPLSGLIINGPNQLIVKLRKKDRFFIDKFASPWIVMFKEDRPLVEIIGSCKVPYQTGRSIIKNCNEKYVEMSYQSKQVFVYDESSAPKNITGNYSKLLTDPPGKEQYASLTVMSAFANPESNKLIGDTRFKIMSNIRSMANELSKQLNLSYSPTISPKWLSLQVSDKLKNIKSKRLECPKEKINILLDTSLPNHEILKEYLSQAIPCDLIFNITNASQYFENFAKNDIGVAWFTPDFMNVYNVFSIFDCKDNICYFNWKDQALQKMINGLRDSVEEGISNIELGSKIEDYVYEKGYASPIADMNWWIKKDDSTEVIHQAGLFQISIGDFL